MRREPIASTRACSTASNTARPGPASGARRRCTAVSWQASLRAIESAWPRSTATSCGFSLRGGSGRRALSPISAGRSDANVTSRSPLRAMARMVPATERFSGSEGASFLSPGLRLEMDIRRALLHRVELERPLEDVGPIVRARGGELVLGKVRLVRRPHARALVRVRERLFPPGLQTRVVLHERRKALALLANGMDPASLSELGLLVPFQHVHDQNAKDAPQLRGLAPAHARQLLGDVLGIDLVESSGPQQRDLLIDPGIEVVLVARAPPL